jgi:hypothetical protein
MYSTVKKISFILACPIISLFFSGQVLADKITLKIASGHSPSWHFIQLTQNYFMPIIKNH